ncbi:hypothetical protein ACFL4A_03920 [bacterium]
MSNKTLLKICFLLITFSLLITKVFAYQVTDANKILANPTKYKNKKVIIFTKFNEIISDGKFDSFTSRGIDYIYDDQNKELSDSIKKLKKRDRITIKGKVIDMENSFIPTVLVEGISKEWVDMTIIQATREEQEIDITCPNCGHNFKHTIELN